MLSRKIKGKPVKGWRSGMDLTKEDNFRMVLASAGICRQAGFNKRVTLENLTDEFGLSESEARQFLKKYDRQIELTQDSVWDHIQKWELPRSFGDEKIGP